MSDTAVAGRTVEFFNMEQPELRLLIGRDPSPGVNPLLAADKFAEFRAGHFSTDDPVIIEALKQPKYRAKGVRCRDNPADIAEYGSDDEKLTYMELEIERRVAERLETERVQQLHATKSIEEVSDAQALESVAPEE